MKDKEARMRIEINKRDIIDVNADTRSLINQVVTLIK